MATRRRLERIGYWRPRRETLEANRESPYWEGLRRYPDVRNFVDPDWDSSERHLVADYLARGTHVNHARGLSDCRFCGQHNGSAEITDGSYCWPEGLAHYVNDHDVRLAQMFVTYVRESRDRPGNGPPPEFDDLGQRDRSWRPSGSMVWEPNEDRELADGYYLVGDVEEDRWVQCQHP